MIETDSQSSVENNANEVARSEHLLQELREHTNSQPEYLSESSNQSSADEMNSRLSND